MGKNAKSETRTFSYSTERIVLGRRLRRSRRRKKIQRQPFCCRRISVAYFIRQTKFQTLKLSNEEKKKLRFTSLPFPIVAIKSCPHASRYLNITILREIFGILRTYSYRYCIVPYFSVHYNVSYIHTLVRPRRRIRRPYSSKVTRTNFFRLIPRIFKR